jgi:hypothetical protein
MNRTQDKYSFFWNNLSQNSTLTSLDIPHTSTLEGREHDFFAALLDLTIKRFEIGNFQPRIAGWDRLFESVCNNFDLGYIRSEHLDRLNCGWKKKADLPEDERRYAKKLMRIFRRSKVGRRVIKLKAVSTLPFGPSFSNKSVHRLDLLGSGDPVIEK